MGTAITVAGSVLAGAVRSFSREVPVPGVAAALALGDETAVHVQGVSDAAAGTPVTPATVFPLDSVSKVLVAVCVLDLVESGAVGLDDPARAHLRGLDVRPRRRCREAITVRQLLTHTSGLAPDYPWLRLSAPAGEDVPFLPLSRLYGPAVHGIDRPGRQVRYSNHNYSVLAQLVEDVRGLPYEEVVTERVLRPLGLTRTGFRPDPGDAGTARGHVWTGSRFVRPPEHRSLLTACTGAWASVDDLLRLGRALLPSGGGPTVLAAPTRRLLTSSQFAVGPGPGVGLGVELRDLGGVTVACRNAFSAGATCTLQLVPERETVLVVLAATSALRAVDALADVVLGQVLGLPPSPSRPVPGSSRDRRPELAGRYARDPRPFRWRAGHRFEVRGDGGLLLIELRSAADGVRDIAVLRPVDPADPDAYEVDSIAAWQLGVGSTRRACPVRFRRDASGRVVGLELGSVAAAPRRPTRLARLARLGGGPLRRTAATVDGLLTRAAVTADGVETAVRRVTSRAARSGPLGLAAVPANRRRAG
jgi:CubicO group peptidase (beta-lactamase class C family)